MSLELVGSDPTDIDSGLSEFDQYICVDMEFSGNCIRQDRLMELGANFEAVELPAEVICLREHSCCRSRLAHCMVLAGFAQSKEDAVRRIVKYFIDPQGDSEHFEFYVNQSVNSQSIYPSWYLQKECMPPKLFDLYNEHLAHTDEAILGAAESQAIVNHLHVCFRCRSVAEELPMVAFSLF